MNRQTNGSAVGVMGGVGVATAREEVFGPVTIVIEACDEEDALRLANDTEYGLSSAVHTRDLERGVRFGRSLDAGPVPAGGLR